MLFCRQSFGHSTDPCRVASHGRAHGLASSSLRRESTGEERVLPLPRFEQTPSWVDYHGAAHCWPPRFVSHRMPRGRGLRCDHRLNSASGSRHSNERNSPAHGGKFLINHYPATRRPAARLNDVDDRHVHCHGGITRTSRSDDGRHTGPGRSDCDTVCLPERLISRCCRNLLRGIKLAGQLRGGQRCCGSNGRSRGSGLPLPSTSGEKTYPLAACYQEPPPPPPPTLPPKLPPPLLPEFEDLACAA